MRIKIFLTILLSLSFTRLFSLECLDELVDILEFKKVSISCGQIRPNKKYPVFLKIVYEIKEDKLVNGKMYFKEQTFTETKILPFECECSDIMKSVHKDEIIEYGQNTIITIQEQLKECREKSEELRNHSFPKAKEKEPRVFNDQKDPAIDGFRARLERDFELLSKCHVPFEVYRIIIKKSDEVTAFEILYKFRGPVEASKIEKTRQRRKDHFAKIIASSSKPGLSVDVQAFKKLVNEYGFNEAYYIIEDYYGTKKAVEIKDQYLAIVKK